MAKGLHAQEARAFSARLKQALEAAGVRPSPAVVASEFNLRYWGKSITAHTARAWLAGLAIPTQDKIRTLSAWLHVNPDELRFGAGRGALELGGVHPRAAEHRAEPPRLGDRLRRRRGLRVGRQRAEEAARCR